MDKTIHYRTLDWLGPRHDILAMLRQTLAARPNVDDTAFNMGIEGCEVRHRITHHRGMVWLHFSTFVEGARRGVNPRAAGVPHADLASAGAPPNSEFVEREIAVVVRQTDLGYVAAGQVRGGTVEKALKGLLGLQYPAAVTSQLALSARADPQVMQQLLEEGVSSLDLDLNLPHADAHQLVDGQQPSVGGRLRNAFKQAISARFMDELGEDQIEQLVEANTRLSLNFRKNAPLEQIQALTAIATAAVDEQDEFKITTVKGNSFSHDSLALKGHYNQPGGNSILAYDLAWTETAEFLGQI